VAYGYLMEVFFSWYSANKYERFMMWNRMHGPYAHTYWMLIFCNCLIPQFLWFRPVRTSIPILFIISIIVNVGMWLERYVIVITSLHRDFVPGAWGMYHGTFWDYATYYGTIGLFFFLMLLFIRFLPMISIAEMRELVAETQERHEAAELHVQTVRAH
jgi:molybdopterin-containing oxidoreductase family membrane subunit